MGRTNPTHQTHTGSTLFQRLSSFLAGVGATSLIGFYFLYQDVKRCVDSDNMEWREWLKAYHDSIIET